MVRALHKFVMNLNELDCHKFEMLTKVLRVLYRKTPPSRMKCHHHRKTVCVLSYNVQPCALYCSAVPDFFFPKPKTKTTICILIYQHPIRKTCGLWIRHFWLMMFVQCCKDRLRKVGWSVFENNSFIFVVTFFALASIFGIY